MPRRTTDKSTKKLLIDPSGQLEMFEKSYQQELEERKNKPVECLGMTFPNDDARREYFMEKLREELQNPEFRKIEGFPIGEDEDILALSNPPYYTACPNPFISDFIKHYGKPYDPNVPYSREPFAADVSEGKNDPIYNAHRYHTKVPPKAILRYLLHYTDPGDIVLDGFSGSGMLGVAAQMCSSPNADIRSQLETEMQSVQWGPRRIILGDLSPIASFISYNQSNPPIVPLYEKAMASVIKDAVSECGWMYETHTSRGNPATIYHTVWSEVLLCPSCSSEMIFWDVAVNNVTGMIAKDLKCPSCGEVSTKRQHSRATETEFDTIMGEPIPKARYVPVAIRIMKRGDRSERPPSDHDLSLIKRITQTTIPYSYPTASIEREIDMWYERDYRSLGLFTLNGFYTPRNLWAFSSLWSRGKKLEDTRIRHAVLFTLTAMAVNLSKMNCWRHNVSFPYNPISGTLYVGALPVESNVFYGVQNKAKRLSRIWTDISNTTLVIVSTQSCADLSYTPDSSVDYVFTDPPFGSNIIYSDLSLLYEGWLQLETSTDQEAVVHRRKKGGKDLSNYRDDMTACFTEYKRTLKPGRWLTMVFHNTRNSVWIAIQEALNKAGFVIADVRVLDKQQGSFKQLTAAGAVKQDLVISAYKPNDGLEDRFNLTAGTEDGVWDFVRTHIKQLPVFVSKEGQAEIIAERQNYLLFDRMVAFHVQRSVTIPLSAAEFYAGLDQRFSERDGMYFLPDQTEEYDRKRITVKRFIQLELIPRDEESAIQWLRQLLKEKPQTFQELNPRFMREIGGWEKYEKPLELSEILAENFLRYNGKEEVPSQIHSYLSSNWPELRKKAKGDLKLKSKAKDRWYVPDPNKAGDLEKLRERALMKEFWDYLPAGYKPAASDDQQPTLPGIELKDVKTPKGKKLKVIRLEAVRAGFKHCWQNRDYRTIIAVAQRIPENVLQEDSKLLMWYDQALTRSGEGT